ncbi:MAG: glycosyltransferase [Candidatus Muiribacteriota bacterium]
MKNKKNILIFTNIIYSLPFDRVTISKFKALSRHFNIFVFGRNYEILYTRIYLYASFFLIKNFRNRILDKIVLYMAALFFLPGIISKNHIKYIIFQNAYDYPVMFFLRLLYGKKLQIVLEFHGNMFESCRYYQMNKLKQKIALLWTKKSIQLSDKIRTVSTKCGIKRKNTDVMFPEDMNINYFIKPLEVDRRKQILFAGALNKVKNIEEIINFFDKYMAKKGYSLVIAGEGPYKDALEKYACSRKSNSKILFKDFLSKEQLKYEFYKSQIMIICSHYEGFGKIGIEAASAGVKVFVKSNCGLADYIPGRYVYKNTEELAQKINNVQNYDNSFIEQFIDDKHYINSKKNFFNNWNFGRSKKSNL